MSLSFQKGCNDGIFQLKLQQPLLYHRLQTLQSIFFGYQEVSWCISTIHLACSCKDLAVHRTLYRATNAIHNSLSVGFSKKVFCTWILFPSVQNLRTNIFVWIGKVAHQKRNLFSLFDHMSPTQIATLYGHIYVLPPCHDLSNQTHKLNFDFDFSEPKNVQWTVYLIYLSNDLIEQHFAQ